MSDTNVIKLRAGLYKFWSDFLTDYIQHDNHGNDGEDWRPYLLSPMEKEDLRAECSRLDFLRVAAPYGAIASMVRDPQLARELMQYRFPVVAIEEALYTLPVDPPPTTAVIILAAALQMENINIVLDRMIQLENYKEEIPNGTSTDTYPSDTEPPPCA